jgi:hypothetical protein
MGAAVLGAMAITLLLWGEPARGLLTELLGIGSRELGGRRATIQGLGLLVLVALILAVDPEIRGILIFINDVGLDVFLTLLAFQGRECLLPIHESVLRPMAQRLANWGWYPMALPSRWLFREHPLWGVYATVRPVAVAAVIAAVSLVVTSPIGYALSVPFRS